MIVTHGIRDGFQKDHPLSAQGVGGQKTPHNHDHSKALGFLKEVHRGRGCLEPWTSRKWMAIFL